MHQPSHKKKSKRTELVPKPKLKPKLKPKQNPNVELRARTGDREGARHNWYGRHQSNVSHLTEDALERLALELEVSTESLREIGVGIDHNVYTFPEYDADGYICGIHRRTMDGGKKCETHSQRGLALPHLLSLGSMDTLFIVEGHSDLAALLTMGLKGIGRPGRGLAGLPKYLRAVPTTCKIVMVGENDGSDESPGWMAAEQKAQDLADELGRPILSARMPDEIRDTREFLLSRGFEPDPTQIGQWYVEELLADPQIFQPTGADRFEVLDMSSFMALKDDRDWLVEGVLAANQPGVIGGPKKALKTSMAIDLTVSLATGTNFLNRFEVRSKRRVGVFSAESGKITLQHLAKRILHRLGDGCPEHQHIPIHWCFDVPKFSDETDLKALTYHIRQYKLEVVIIDPLYLCALSGSKSGDASNMYHMGPLFRAASEACLKAGATPLFVHHSRKMPNSGKEKWAKYEPLDLDDLAFAGIGEFARQWLLLNRSEAYVPHEGVHRLWLSVGGSAFGGRVFGLTVDEGRSDGTFSGRKWIPRVMSFDDVAAQQKERRQEMKESKKDDQLQQILDVLGRLQFRDGATITDIRKCGVDKSTASKNLATLIAEGKVESCKVTKPSGRGKQEYSAYKLSVPVELKPKLKLVRRAAPD